MLRILVFVAEPSHKLAIFVPLLCFGASAILNVKVTVVFSAVKQTHFLLNLCAAAVTAG